MKKKTQAEKDREIRITISKGQQALLKWKERWNPTLPK